jgi:hypothetical protein
MASSLARALLAPLLAALALPHGTRAASHLWRFHELYSSPDRSVQFIEMIESGGSDSETGIANHWFETDSYNADHSQRLDEDLPFGTAHKTFLVGTQSYAALPGVPEPDYVVPDGIIDPEGDTVIWWFYQTLVIPPDTMPSDGVNALKIDDFVNVVLTTGPNSPKNFAGETGTIVPAVALPALPLWGLALVAALLAAGFRLVRRAGS